MLKGNVMQNKFRNRASVALVLAMACAVGESAFGQALDFRWLPKNNFGANGYLNGQTLFENGAGYGVYDIGSDDTPTTSTTFPRCPATTSLAS